MWSFQVCGYLGRQSITEGAEDQTCAIRFSDLLCQGHGQSRSFMERTNPDQVLKLFTSQLMRLWYLSHRRIAKAAVLPEPSLFAHIKYGSRRRVWPKIRRVAQVDCCEFVFEDWVYGGR